jgi:ABC-type sugar transport system substrate-binding protein
MRKSHASIVLALTTAATIVLSACAVPQGVAPTVQAAATQVAEAAPTVEAAAKEVATKVEEAKAAMEVPADWKAGIPKNAPDRAGKNLVIRDVPKLIGIGYFAATTKGMEEAAKELGNIDFKTDAPTEAKIEKQIEFLDNFITQGVDVLLYASNDPVAIAPVLKKALDQGILVIGYDADAEEDARQFFVNQATFEAFAQALIEDMVAQVGPEADIAIVTSSLTAPNQNRWIEEMKKYIAEKYPKLNIVTILPSEEDQQLAFKAAQDIMKTYPNVKGIIGLSSVAFPGVTDAIKQAGNCGKIASVGASTPNQMRPFVEEGCAKDVVLWNPVDLGYAALYAARALADGKLKPGDTEFEAGRLGKLKVRGSEILLGDPFVFTKDNIGNFDF